MTWDRTHYKDHCLIDESAKIHKTAVIGPDSMSIKWINGELIQFKHTGRVIIYDDAEIGPLSVIHRASVDETIIHSGTKIGTMVNIGHNSVIGNNCVIISGVNIGGSVMIGSDVWIGMGVLIKPHINICSHAVIGIGSVVLDDIVKPGIYVGNPAKFLKERGEGKPL